MRSRTTLACALALVAAVARPAAAQDIHAFVAWAAMMSTPYGSLPPAVTRAMAGGTATGGSSFELRYGHWAFDGESDAVHIGGIGARVGKVGFVVGYEGCSGCDGGIIGGVDYEAVLLKQTLAAENAHSLFTLGLRPALGLGHTLGGGGSATAITATLDAPIAVSVPVGKTAKMVPYVSPGFGVGAVRSGDESESGTRGALAFGVGLVDLAPGLGLNLGWRKIFLQDAPMTIGLGLTFER
jgi:hypothetical protein